MKQKSLYYKYFSTHINKPNYRILKVRLGRMGRAGKADYWKPSGGLSEGFQ